MRNVYLITAFVVVLVVSVLGFRGSISIKPPADVFPEWAFPGMKRQPKYKPQAASEFFADGRTDRVPPAHVVQRGMLREDDRLYQGKNPDGTFFRGFPAPIVVNAALLDRGRDRYSIFCQPCHGAVGDGNGVTKKYGMGATATYPDDRLRAMAEGEIFNTITNGKGNMLSYADKLVPEDRWAVIAYVRALQRAHNSTLDDVPADHKSDLGLK